MRLVLACLLLAPLAARACAGWSAKPDSADDKGHLFICVGEGKSEADALDSALGVCNDKICKVCGVEIESIVETKETLKGVDLQRKVIERCRRVRKSDPQLKSKSVECDEGKCQAWVQLFYSKEDEKAECPGYAREDFADPNACEADIEAFRRQEGRSAESFRKRRAQLEAALIHCEKIDVRPTPALLAIDEKLRAGLGQFAPSGNYQERFADAYLPVHGPTLQAFAETRTLAGRIQTLLDLVSNKALVMDVVEAADAEEFDSPAGLARLLAALQAAPLGGQYGTPDVHFAMMWRIEKSKSDTRALADFYRTRYPPETPRPEVGPSEWNDIALVLATDGQTTADEWDWGLRVTKAALCSRCLLPLIRARDHGGAEVRMARFYQGLEAVRAAYPRRSPRRPEAALLDLLPMHDVAFVLQAELAAPPEWKAGFDYELFQRLTGNFDDLQDERDQAKALQRAAETAASPPDKGEPCSELSRRLEPLKESGAPPVPGLGEAVCGCLTGPLLDRRRDEKQELLQYALDQHLSCAEKP